jgi:hypothetical protein
MIRTTRRQISVMPIAEGDGSRLTFSLPRGRGSKLAYALQGSVECEIAPNKVTAKGVVTVARAYGVARLCWDTAPPEGAPRQIEFHLARPVRVPLSGRPVNAELDLIFPELLQLKKYRTQRPRHPFAIRPVRAKVRLQAMWENGFAGLLISGTGRVPIPTIATRPLLAAFVFCCLCPPKKAKCKTLCLDIKVGPRATGEPVMTNDEVKRVIARVNEIWGCKAPGQCCIEFTVADDAITTPANLPAAVKVRTGTVHPDHTAATGIARSTTCFNLYYVENMVPDPAPASGGVFPGMTLGGDAPSSLVQYPPNAGYTNETLATVTAHEIGHALGLAWQEGTDGKGVDKHHNQAANLMHNVANLGTKLNADQCAKARESPLLKDTDHDCESRPGEV